jgi:DNA modification methylase
VGYYDVGKARVWLGDCLDVAKHYPDDHFQLLLTSTPYPGLAGFNKTVEEYMWWWESRFRAWYPKVHHETGVIVQVVKFGRTKNGQFDTGIFQLVDMYKHFYRMFCIDVFPWVKPNAPPTGNHARHDRDAYEFCFAFGRSPYYTYNKLRKPYAKKTVGKAKSGNMRQTDVRGSVGGGHADLHPEGATLDNVLRMSSTGGAEQFRPRVKGGVFPMALADRFILEFSNVQDRVVDPFCGSGTVLARSLVHDRVPVGVDIEEQAVLSTVEWLNRGVDPEEQNTKAQWELDFT